MAPTVAHANAAVPRRTLAKPLDLLSFARIVGLFTGCEGTFPDIAISLGMGSHPDEVRLQISLSSYSKLRPKNGITRNAANNGKKDHTGKE